MPQSQYRTREPLLTGLQLTEVFVNRVGKQLKESIRKKKCAAPYANKIIGW